MIDSSNCGTVNQCKQIANQFKNELGFVNSAALKESLKRDEVIVIEGVGFVHFHHRRDGQTTIYSLAVNSSQQGQGWGRLLFYRVLCSAIERKQSKIVLKCPVDLSANCFYSHLGFELIAIEAGKKRALNKWEYKINLPLLFYCADGGRNKYSKISQELGWKLGFRSSEIFPKNHVEMVDNHWKKYDHDRHLEAVKKYKPLIATARDIEHPEQLPEILKQAAELSQYCGRVLLIPKCEFEWPYNFLFWLAYSIPTSHGGTTLATSYFRDRPVHLLGGSPTLQARFAERLNVVSLDGNYAMKVAQWGKSVYVGCDRGEKLTNGVYSSFEISLQKIKAYWRKEWKIEDEPLFKSIINN